MLRTLAGTTAILLSLPVAAADVTWALGPTFGGVDGHLGILGNGTRVGAVHLAGSGRPARRLEAA